MFLGGLWHGAGWNFVFWGLLHGGFLIINHTYRQLGGSFLLFLEFCTDCLFTYHAQRHFWLDFFRAETFQGALNILLAMLGQNKILVPSEIYGFLPKETHFLLISESENKFLYWSGSLTWDAFPLIIIIAFFFSSSAISK